jgi:hypothetical protein
MADRDRFNQSHLTHSSKITLSSCEILFSVEFGSSRLEYENQKVEGGKEGTLDHPKRIFDTCSTLGFRESASQIKLKIMFSS